ncbi:hypothetical protein [Dyella telluris]|uniref:Uncharacterized protein n=1 Tax=Dyella telluris TaxID=2763498 RepID=A0A7G8Q3V0_9GAMM|nr:hypothetical protein [Dyella telluris]QNK01458.1 hypothetical protein H8F01_20890 [Dyella telluris]
MSHPQLQSHRAALGLRACKGGAVAVGLMDEAGEPRIAFSTFLETRAEGDRLSLEPYGVASELIRESNGRAMQEAADAVATGRHRQEQQATRGLRMLLARLESAGAATVVGALLVNRAGWITDLLSYSLAWAEHVPVAEALAVRDAIRHAFSECGIGLVELDEKSLPDLAGKSLGLSSTEQLARLRIMGVVAGRPWRKEQKLACLSAWLALQTRA